MYPVRRFLVLAAGAFPADLIKWLAGERDFRDFSCLPPAKENRAQPADPAPADLTVAPSEVHYVDRRRQTEGNEAGPERDHQRAGRQPEVLCGYWGALERRDPEASVSGGIPEAC